MATGYTHPVADGEVTDFTEFASKCVRAFGIMVEFRDDPSAPIPEAFTVSKWYQEGVEHANKALDAAELTPDEELEQRQDHEIEAAIERREESERERNEKRDRYALMLGHAIVYKAPTKEHEGYREFMIDQLTTSITHDCRLDFLPGVPERLPVDDYRAKLIDRAEEDLVRAEKRLAEEQERVASKNAWLDDWKKSLGL